MIDRNFFVREYPCPICRRPMIIPDRQAVYIAPCGRCVPGGVLPVNDPKEIRTFEAREEIDDDLE